jgi:hypothetical protein
MSEQSSIPVKSAPNQSGGGCWRTALFGFLAIFALTFLGGIAFLFASAYALNRTVSQPVAALVKSIGINATPVIRPDPVTIMRQINNLARLETAEYLPEKIISADTGPTFLGLFDDNLLFVARGQVIAGVDLVNLTPADIQAVTYQTVTIRLPAAEIFVATLDNENSYVADRDIGIGRRISGIDVELETRVRQEAVGAIEQAALEGGILELADENAKKVVEGLLKAVGFQAVVFIDGDMPPPVQVDPEQPKGFIISP